MSKKPNILFALADDASHFGCSGAAWVRTPVIDRLAADGVRFRNMFTPNPKCAPSRACMLTGKHPWQAEDACNHWCVFPGAARLTVYPDLLEQAGYHVGFTGKGWAPGDYQRNGRPRNPAGNAYQQRKLNPPEGSAISGCDYGANFSDFLDDRTEGSPFCFWYGCHEPHRPYVRGEGSRSGRDPNEIPEVPSFWPDEETVRRDLLDYAFEIEWFDTQLGIMVSELEKRGELDNTLILVTSDNGCPFPRVKGQMYDNDFRLPFVAHWPAQMPGGRVIEDLCSFIDLMPTYLELAGCPVPAVLPGRSLLPLLRSTVSGVVDPTRDRAFMGREQHDLGREGDVGYPVRCIRTPEFLLSVNFEPDRWPAGNPETGFPGCDSSPTKERILALKAQGDTRCFDLAFGKRPRFELFDIVSDPECLKNLAEDPEYLGTRESLFRELMRLLEDSGDPRLEDPEYFDRMEYVGHETCTHSWQALQEGRWAPQRH